MAVGPKYVRDGTDCTGTCENGEVSVTATRQLMPGPSVHRHNWGKEISYLRVRLSSAEEQHIQGSGIS